VLIALIVVLGILYLRLASESAPLAPGWDFAKQLIPNIVVALGGYLILNFLFFREQLGTLHAAVDHVADAVRERLGHAAGVEALHRNVWEPDYGTYIAQAEGIRLLCRFFNDWVGHHSDELSRFFANGGVFELLVPSCDGDDDALLTSYSQQNRVRGRGDPSVMRRRVELTIEKLTRALEEAEPLRKPSAPRGELIVVRTRRHINYWALVMDDKRVVYAPYAQWAHDTQCPPVHVLDLKQLGNAQAWLNRELSEFRRAGDGCGPSSATPA